MLSVADQQAWTTRINESREATGTSPEQARRDKVERISFYDHFKALNEKLLQRQKSLWRSYYMLWLRSALYYDGKQILVPRSGGFGYDIRQLRGTDHPIYVYNKLRPYSDEVTSMWVQSSPEVLFAVLDQDDRRAAKAIGEIETLNKYFNYLHLTEKNLELIAKGGQFCGNYHFEVWFDPDDQNGWEWYEDYKPLQIPESLWYECLDCGQLGEMPENASCPHCGSQMVTPTMMPAVNIPDALEGQSEWRQAGEVVCRPFPAWSQRYNLATGAADSPWRYAEEDLPKEKVEAQFGKLDGRADDQSFAQDESMHPERVMRRAQRARGYDFGDSEDDLDNVLSQRFWYNPEMLSFVSCDAPVTLPGGRQIPPDQRLSDVFPQGMCIMTAPGLPRFLNVYDEMHAKRFVDGVYGITPGVQVGHGIEDGVEMQRQKNLLRSGRFRYLQKTLQPSIAVNNRVFQNTDLFNRVDHVISINNATLPEGTKVSDHFAQVVPPPVHPQIFAVDQELDADIQAALKAYNSSGDFAGIENPTATAARIGVAKSATAHNLYLALYAGTLKDLAVRRIELAQEHYGELRLVQSVDTLSGERKSKEINALSIRQQVMAWIKIGSFMPNLQMEKRAAFIEAAGVVAQLAPLGLLNPASIAEINEKFQTDFSFENRTEKIEQCEEALDLMWQAFELSGGIATPEELYSLSPADPYALGHEAKIHFWRDWRGSKEGREAPEQIREAVAIHIMQEYAALVEEQALLAGASAAGQSVMVAATQPPEEQEAGHAKEKGRKPNSKPNGQPNPMQSEGMATMENPMMSGV